jgi:hypothetical protein
MEYFVREYMYSHTHIYKQIPIFLLFFIKIEENEGDSMAKVWMIKNLPIGWGLPPPIRFQTQVYLVFI